MSKPLAIDLFCGLGGFTEGLLAEGYFVVGFDIERHRYPARALPESEAVKAPMAMASHKRAGDGSPSSERSFNYANECKMRDAPLTGEWQEYPAQLVLQDVLTLHGSQFKDAALIVASPPCQEYSYMAMPWSRAKQIAREYRDGTRDVAKLTALFDACFRIQAEAIAAAGHHIPLVVENVRGAIPWVGRSRWNYGSFQLWGDVPCLMPMTQRCMKNGSGGTWFAIQAGDKVGERNNPDGRKAVGYNLNKGEETKWRPHRGGDGSGRSMQTESVDRHIKVQSEDDGCKTFGGESLFPKRRGEMTAFNRLSSKSSARKAASAMIAKIPLPLARHIAQVYYPREMAA